MGSDGDLITYEDSDSDDSSKLATQPALPWEGLGVDDVLESANTGSAGECAGDESAQPDETISTKRNLIVLFAQPVLECSELTAHDAADQIMKLLRLVSQQKKHRGKYENVAKINICCRACKKEYICCLKPLHELIYSEAVRKSELARPTPRDLEDDSNDANLASQLTELEPRCHLCGVEPSSEQVENSRKKRGLIEVGQQSTVLRKTLFQKAMSRSGDAKSKDDRHPNGVLRQPPPMKTVKHFMDVLLSLARALKVPRVIHQLENYIDLDDDNALQWTAVGSLPLTTLDQLRAFGMELMFVIDKAYRELNFPEPRTVASNKEMVKNHDFVWLRSCFPLSNERIEETPPTSLHYLSSLLGSVEEKFRLAEVVERGEDGYVTRLDFTFNGKDLKDSVPQSEHHRFVPEKPIESYGPGDAERELNAVVTEGRPAKETSYCQYEKRYVPYFEAMAPAEGRVLPISAFMMARRALEAEHRQADRAEEKARADGVSEEAILHIKNGIREIMKAEFDQLYGTVGSPSSQTCSCNPGRETPVPSSATTSDGEMETPPTSGDEQLQLAAKAGRAQEDQVKFSDPSPEDRQRVLDRDEPTQAQERMEGGLGAASRRGFSTNDRQANREKRTRARKDRGNTSVLGDLQLGGGSTVASDSAQNKRRHEGSEGGGPVKRPKNGPG